METREDKAKSRVFEYCSYHRAKKTTSIQNKRAKREERERKHYKYEYLPRVDV